VVLSVEFPAVRRLQNARCLQNATVERPANEWPREANTLFYKRLELRIWDGPLPALTWLDEAQESPAPRKTISALESPMIRNKKGFTLIELLIVVVIIGILAAIAIPKFAKTKEKAYLAAMKSDLRNGATYEESYAADSAGTYFSGNGTAQGFTPSQNVTVTFTAVAGPPASWVANATHTLTPKTCASSANGLITCT
jgi:prepilin-type N-terminal cleavage/methylation domain-containing protein